MSETQDVFFSYRRSDLPRAERLLDALTAAGIRVWRDQTDLAANSSITQEIRRALASSRAAIAFYSLGYPLSQPCQQEITMAWIAAQHMGEVPQSRVLIINPESGFDHIPEVLRDQQSMGWREDAAGLATLVEKLMNHVRSLKGTLGGGGLPASPDYMGMAPVHTPRFVGRVKELWALHGRLTANRTSIITGIVGQATAQVRGLGGNGKSLLAREYAIRFGPSFPGGVFWVGAFGNDETRGPLDSESRDALRQDQIRAFAIRQGIPSNGMSATEIEAAFWKRLADLQKPCLWIVDDLPSGLNHEEVENRWNAQWSGASTLITTRSTRYEAFGGHIDLDVLNESEAIHLLTSRRKPDGTLEEDAAGEIANELGFHPLAIEVAGSFLAKRIQSFAEYLRDLKRQDTDALEFGAQLREQLPIGHERSVVSTLLKSVRLVGQEGMDLLRLASRLAVAPIPIRLIQLAMTEALQIGNPVMYVTEALDQVESLSLCTGEGDDARGVHTLVSRAVRHEVGNDSRTAMLRAGAAEALVKSLTAVTDIRQHQRLGREITHARRLLADDISTVTESFLATFVAHYEYERGNHGLARTLHEQVLTARERLLGVEHPSTLEAAGNLAATIMTQGDLERARQLQTHVLTETRRVLGDEAPATLTAMHNLAWTITKQGHLREAQEIQHRVMESRKRLQGEEHPDTLKAMSALARTLYGLGDLTSARRLEDHVLETRRRVLGEDHKDTLIAMDNLALTMTEQGNLSEARQLTEQVLLVSQRTLGEDHPETAKAMRGLAGLLRKQGLLAQALELAERVLEGFKRLLGGHHLDTLTAMSDFGLMLREQGHVTRARQLQEETLTIVRQREGDYHPLTTVAAWNLCLTLEEITDDSEENLEAEIGALLTTHVLWLLPGRSRSASCGTTTGS